MLFTSTIEKDHRTTEHLVIFCHEERRVLLPLPDNFEDALKLVKEEFLLSSDSSIVFVAEEIPGCYGLAVEIHQQSWQTITPILARIILKVSGRPLPSEVPTILEAVEEDNFADGGASAKVDTPTREDQPAAVTKVRKRPSMAAAGPSADGYISRQSRQSANGSRPRAENQTATLQGHTATKPFLTPFTGMSSTNKAPVDVTTPQQAFNDDEELELLPRSPKKGGSRSARKRVVSDDEDAQATGPSNTAASSSHSTIDLTATQQSPPQQHSPLQSNSARTPSRTSVGRLSLSLSSLVLKPSEAAVRPGDTCLITVSYDDGQELCSSTFKTKGRHTVQKVLMTVCKTFNIEHLYNRAKLVRVVTDSTDDMDSDEQVMEQMVFCPKDHTMTQVGAHQDARFTIAIEEDDSDTL
ncbi:hypothetical protein BDW22DRAFT_1428158 [Trametopsis cervina]|nr:hypothetical protein BDW22DRAFT_1428158 [Trametopsis cervina]